MHSGRYAREKRREQGKARAQPQKPRELSVKLEEDALLRTELLQGTGSNLDVASNSMSRAGSGGTCPSPHSRRLRQVDHKFELSLGNSVNLSENLKM